MTATHHASWTDEHANFPEEFNWNLLDSPKCTVAAHKIVNAIREDFKTPERGLVRGLREALRIIAASCETHER